jgi:hypothetical protein
MDFKLILIAVLSEAFLHYLPWRGFLRGHELPRPAAYALGVLGLMLPYGFWLYERGLLQEIYMLVALIFFGGSIVVLCYLLDALIDVTWRANHAEEREEKLEEIRHVQG